VVHGQGLAELPEGMWDQAHAPGERWSELLRVVPGPVEVRQGAHPLSADLPRVPGGLADARVLRVLGGRPALHEVAQGPDQGPGVLGPWGELHESAAGQVRQHRRRILEPQRPTQRQVHFLEHGEMAEQFADAFGLTGEDLLLQIGKETPTR